MGGELVLPSIKDDSKRQIIERNLNEQYNVAIERRGQFYGSWARPPTMEEDPRFMKLENVLLEETKKKDWVRELGISDEDLRLLIRGGIRTAVNLKAETPTEEAGICIANGICVGILSVYADQKTVNDFIAADQKGKMQIFNNFMNQRLGSTGKDYYGKIMETAIYVAVAYKIFTNPSDANLKDLQAKHSSILSMIAPYLSYLFAEKERKNRDALQKLIAQYGKQESFF